LPTLTIVADLRDGAALAESHSGRLADRDLEPLVPAAPRVLDQNVADLAHVATISRLVHHDIQPRTATSITSADSAALA
jgi:DNA-binding HxlR family transcriptional regulator